MKLRAAVCLFALLTLLATPKYLFSQSSQVSNSSTSTAVLPAQSNLLTLRGNTHPLAQAQFDRGPALGSSPTGRIFLVLRRTQAQQQALTQYLADLQNPASPSYHKWLTPAQYGAKFGANLSDIQQVSSWLQSYGFKVRSVPAANNVIEFSGTVDQVQSAFHTAVHTFAIQGKTYFANISDPQIPAAFGSIIAGVGPLNNFGAQPNVKLAARGEWNPMQHSIQPTFTVLVNNSNYLFVDPADAATIYDAPNSALNPNYTSGTNYTGSGATIGIVGVSNINMPDVENFRTGFLGESTTNANLPTVIVDGDDPGLVVGGAGLEALLDNEVAGGLAPGAKIDFYISAGSDLSNGLLNAMARAIADNAVDILNISFSACETDLGTSGNALVLELEEQAAAQGITLTVSAGDGGSAGCDNFDTQTSAAKGFAVNGFASTPYAVAVGGTDFDALPPAFSTYVNTATSAVAPYYLTAKSYIPEKPWNDSTTVNTKSAQNVAYKDSLGNTNIVAAGGGASSVYAKPAFQSSLTTSDLHRDLPDVSLFSGDGFYSAVWLLCADSLVDNSDPGTLHPDCVNTGGQFSSGSFFSGAGGTSAAAPALAGMLALAVQATGGRLGQADSVLYQLVKNHPSYFHDVTSGDNAVPCTNGSPNCASNGFLSGYDAGTGYDLASGLGSIDVAAIVKNWTSIPLGSSSTTLEIDGSSAPYSGTHGANLTFNVGVSGSGGTPTGIVAVIDNADTTAGGTTAGPQNNGQFAIPLTSGSGSATYNGLPGGTYDVSARYGGDTTFAASTSAPITVTISPEPSTTALTVNAYTAATGTPIASSSVPYGSYVIADASITGTAEGSKTQGVATGTVHFMNGSTLLGSGAVSSSNQASWPPLSSAITALPAGVYNITAKYSGDASYNASTSAAVPITVTQQTTTISAQSTLYNLTSTDTATIIVNVNATPNAGVPPTGSVAVIDNGTTLATISSLTPSGFSPFGDVNIQASQLSLGVNALTVKYSGDTNYSGSSTTLDIDYSGNGGFSISPIPAVSIAPGSTVSVPVTLTSSGGFSGPVAFGCSISNSSNNSLTCIVSETSLTGTGPATAMMSVIATSAASPGTYTAQLNGSNISNPKIAASASFTITVSQSQTPYLAVFSNSNLSVSPGETTANSTSVTIIPSGGLSGQVNLTCAVTTSLSSPISPPTCSVPASVTVTSGQSTIVPVSIATSTATTTGDYTFSVTAADAQTPSITGSSSAQLTVTASPLFVLAGPGTPLNFTPSATAKSTATLTATPENGYIGTIDLSCSEAVLWTVQPAGTGFGAPSCAVPSSISVSGTTAASFPLTITATGNPSYPPPGAYLVTVSGEDSSNGNLISSTSVEIIVPNPTVTLSSSGNITVNPGASTGNTSTITVNPSQGFTGTVDLSCSITTSISNPSDPPTCSIPASVTISGTTPVTATLTVKTTAPSSSRLNLPLNKFFLGGAGSALACLLFFGIPARRRAWRALFSVLAIVLVTSVMGCGGSTSGGGGGGVNNPGTTPGSYTVTVTASDGTSSTATAATTVTLTVN